MQFLRGLKLQRVSSYYGGPWYPVPVLSRAVADVMGYDTVVAYVVWSLSGLRVYR